jgi:hypothetical protein
MRNMQCKRTPLDTKCVLCNATTRSGAIVSFDGACARSVEGSLAVAFNVLPPIPGEDCFYS